MCIWSTSCAAALKAEEAFDRWLAIASSSKVRFTRRRTDTCKCFSFLPFLVMVGQHKQQLATDLQLPPTLEPSSREALGEDLRFFQDRRDRQTDASCAAFSCCRQASLSACCLFLHTLLHTRHVYLTVDHYSLKRESTNYVLDYN